MQEVEPVSMDTLRAKDYMQLVRKSTGVEFRDYLEREGKNFKKHEKIISLKS